MSQSLPEAASPQITHQGKWHLQFCVETSLGNFENSGKGTMAATLAGERRFPRCTSRRKEQLKGLSRSLKTPEAKAVCGVAAQETDPVVPLHLNGLLSGKSNKQNVFKPRSKYS